MEASTSTPRSSLTFTELRPVQSQLDQEILDEEARIERYGADDVRDPPSKERYIPPPAEPEKSSFVTWSGPDDPTNPQNFSIPRKWFLTIVCAITTVNVTFASSAPSSVTEEIVAYFGVSTEIGYLVTSLFLVGYVLGPLFWGPGSELFGRRPILIVCLSSYTILHLGQALAKNIETLLITRFLGGFFAVAPAVIGGGLIADIWPAVGRGPATSLFSASVFMGPVLGPIVGGFIATSYLGWQWVFWVMMMFAAACTTIMIVFLPETYAPIILLKKAKRMRKEGNESVRAEHEDQDWSAKGLIHRTVYRPFQMLLMEPILVLITLYLSVVYGVLYALFEAFPVIFIGQHGFSLSQNGLIFIGVGIGTTMGATMNFWFSRKYVTLTPKWKGFPPPEERLIGAMFGAPALVVGSFWLGWTGNYASVPWYVPGLATIVLGGSISLIFMSFLSYLVDTYLMYAASAFAANTMIRSLVGAAFPLFTVQMYDNLGINWASTLIGLIGLLFAPSPFLFYKYGARVRAKSKFAPCLDLKIAVELANEGIKV